MCGMPQHTAAGGDGKLFTHELFFIFFYSIDQYFNSLNQDYARLRTHVCMITYICKRTHDYVPMYV